MTTENQSDDPQQTENGEQKHNPAKREETKNDSTNESGDPGRTPGSAEGDEETIDADIRERDAEGKL
jgi:hypothetical protein